MFINYNKIQSEGDKTRLLFFIFETQYKMNLIYPILIPPKTDQKGAEKGDLSKTLKWFVIEKRLKFNFKCIHMYTRTSIDHRLEYYLFNTSSQSISRDTSIFTVSTEKKEVAYELSIFSDRPGVSDYNGFLYQIISDLYVNYLIFFSYRNQDLVCCIKTYHCKNKMSFKNILEILI